MDTSPCPPSTSGPRVVVVGIAGDGWAGLTADARARIEAASVVVGGERHLSMLPEVSGQRREQWPSPMGEVLPRFLAGLGEGPVVALASGDPFVSGIGTTLVRLLGAERVVVEPAVSSVALARARMGWSAEGCAVVSVVGRDPHRVLREAAPGRRILVLSSDETTPASLAGVLTAAGYGKSRLTVLGDLGTANESRAQGVAASWTLDPPKLNIVAVECIGPAIGGWVAGLPDEAFEHDGQLSKRDVRASALSRLAPRPGERLWDVGAGAGSVCIEWMRAHHSCAAIAIEAEPARAERIGRNARRLGVPELQVVAGRAPQALADLPAPDAVFIGGGATVDGVIGSCLAVLRPGGRLVVHGVTLETEQLLARLYAERGGELTRLSIQAAAPIGSFTGWTPGRTVTQWSLTTSA